jgi:hypothetical protein
VLAGCHFTVLPFEIPCFALSSLTKGPVPSKPTTSVRNAKLARSLQSLTNGLELVEYYWLSKRSGSRLPVSFDAYLKDFKSVWQA